MRLPGGRDLGFGGRHARRNTLRQDLETSSCGSQTDPQLLPDLDLDSILGMLRIVAIALIYLIWVSSADWINRDRYERRVSKGWNVAIVVPFAIFFLAYWIIPFFWVGYPLLFLAYLIPFVVFVTNRNGKVDLDDKVFTKKHLRFWTAKKLEKIGIKIAGRRIGHRRDRAARQADGQGGRRRARRQHQSADGATIARASCTPARCWPRPSTTGPAA